ncbi:MAG: PfkB family carbohydrate kinase [Chitinophagales bacterium]
MQELFNTFRKLRIAIIGDIMLDTYLFGKTDRVSPEAPVPVVLLHSSDQRLGGAANVALNIKALGATAVLFSVCGDDENGKAILEVMKENGISTSSIIKQRSRITTCKTRVLAQGHQIVRIDAEQTDDISGATENALLEKFETALVKGNIDALILQDYNKGVLTTKGIRKILALCKKHKVPVSVDPKEKNFFAYKGCTLFKPNLRELRSSLNKNIPATYTALQSAMRTLEPMIAAQIILVTLGDEGIFLRNNGKHFHISGHVRNVADVSGAGDTVISIATLCLAAGTDMQTLAALSNLGGGIVCEYAGVVPIDADRFRDEAEFLMLQH